MVVKSFNIGRLVSIMSSVTGLKVEEPCFYSQQGKVIFLFSKPCEEFVKPTESTI